MHHISNYIKDIKHLSIYIFDIDEIDLDVLWMENSKLFRL